jgi:hypothetical protein
MPSVPLKHPADLASQAQTNKAHLTVFFNTQSRTNEYILAVFGTNPFGAEGEVAHLRLSEEVFNQLAASYPVTTAVGLTRSENFPVPIAHELLLAAWPPAPPEEEAASS